MLTDLDARLAEFVAGADIPGAAIAVHHRGEDAAAAAGVLNLDTGVEATVDSVFQVGSVTKLFTAALVMQLVDDGLVDLDRPVREHLPAFAVADPHATATVTVRHLLTHTGGFHGDVFTDTGRGDDCLDRYLAHLAGVGQLHPPGALYSYCNSGFCVLGALVATMRGGTWEQAVRERLLEPLGLHRAALFAEEAILHRASAGHQRMPGGDGKVVFRPWQLPRSNAPAGASLTATPGELVRFARMLMAGGVGDTGARVLSATSVAAMLDPRVDLGGPYGARVGLATMVFQWTGADMYGHDGNTIGQDAFLRFLPDHDLVIAACGNGSESMRMLDGLIAPIVAELTGVTPPTPAVPPARPDPVDVTPLVGRYAGPMDEYLVEAAGDGIDITCVPGPQAASWGRERETHHLVHLRDDMFVRVTPVDGWHPVVSFPGGGAYLRAGRVYTRA